MDIKFYLMNKKEQDNLQNVSLENYRACLSAVFSWLAQEEMIPVNPCAKIARIKVEQKVREAFTHEEMDIIRNIAASKNKKLRAIIEFLYSTGCRISEAVALDITDVKFETREVIVHGKGNKDRKVYLSDLAIETLKDYLNTRTDSNPALFINRYSDRISDNGVRRILSNLEPLCNVGKIHPHKFRRTLATDLLNEDINIQDVARILGHANVRVTQKYYDHKDSKVKKEFFDVMKKKYKKYLLLYIKEGIFYYGTHLVGYKIFFHPMN